MGSRWLSSALERKTGSPCGQIKTTRMTQFGHEEM
jgi:hypothetical protein